MQWSELSKPLHSALATQLVLFAAQESIPSDSDVMAQALFWRDNYNADGEVQDFVNAVKRQEGGLICTSILGCLFQIYCQNNGQYIVALVMVAEEKRTIHPV